MSSHGLSATRGFLAARDLLRALRDDHEAATARFSWPRPEYFNWALDWFDRIAVATRVCVGDKVPGWRAYTDAYLERRSFSPDGVTRTDDPLLIYATSGRAGRVRMVCHTHAHPIGTLPGTYWTGLLPGNVHAAATDAGSAEHVWSTFFQPFNAEASVVAVRWTPDAPARSLLDVLGEERVSSLCATPAAWASLLREDGRPPTSLRETRSLGAPLARDLADRARTAWGIDLRNGYGQAETGALIGVMAGLAAPLPGAIGKSLPGHSIVLIDPRTAKPSAGGEEGEICVELAHRPVGLMSGCFGDTESAMASYCGGGFYRTGDLARRDAAGCFTYAGCVADAVTA